jgi:TRAP-type C4-dicarboxylate transport system permease small subunit
MTATIVLQQIVRRYVFGSPTGWSEEAARVLLAWITFVGASAVLRQDGHPRLLLLRDALGPRGRRALDTLADLAVVLLAGCSAGYGFYLVSQVTEVKLVTINMSWAWWYSAVPVGAVLMLLRVAERWIRGRREANVPVGQLQDRAETTC